MNLDNIFLFLSYSPGPFWLLIILFPNSRRAMLLVDAFLILLTMIFTTLTLPHIKDLLPIIATPTLGSIRVFLGSPEGTVGTWNHMILSDLWIGRWVALDLLKAHKSVWLRVLFIIPILFFGPLGLFFYLAYRIASQKKMSLT